MKKQTKNFLSAIIVIAVLSFGVNSCAGTSGIKLGDSGCKLTANYSLVTKDAVGCIVCNTDSMKPAALRTLKKIFPKQNFSGWENLKYGNNLLK